jgi:hypothetical protein
LLTRPRRFAIALRTLAARAHLSTLVMTHLYQNLNISAIGL